MNMTKKTMVYILALSVVLATLLSGCGDMRENRNDGTAPRETDLLPGIDLPDVELPNGDDLLPDPDREDGVVNDTDGIIGDQEDGRTTTAGENDFTKRENRDNNETAAPATTS